MDCDEKEVFVGFFIGLLYNLMIIDFWGDFVSVILVFIMILSLVKVNFFRIIVNFSYSDIMEKYVVF